MSQPFIHTELGPMPPRVVIPVVAGIGNALLAVPMVQAIARATPGIRITIIARTEAMAEPFRRLAGVSEVLVTGSGLKNMLRGVRWTRERRPDVYVVPFPSNRWQYTMLAMTSGAKRRVMHSYPVGQIATGAFLPATRVPAVRGLHDVEQNLALVDAVAPREGEAPAEPGVHRQVTPGSAGASPSRGPTFGLNDADRERAKSLLSSAGIGLDEKFIAIHAGSARTVLATAKRWPPAKYAELIRSIVVDTGMKIVLLEGPDEAGVSDEIGRVLSAEAARGVAPLKLSGPLGETGAVLERAALYVGSDSGLAHLAAAVGTAPVTLFAPADPERVCPYGYRHLVVQTPMSCAPCLQYPWNATKPKLKCSEPMCVTKIEVESVMAKVREALAGGGAPRATLAVLPDRIGHGLETHATVEEGSARKYLGLVKWILFLAVLAFAVHSLSKEFVKIDWAQVHFAPLPLVGGFFCYVAVYVVQMLSYRLLLSAYVKPPGWRAMAAVAWIPPMGKYIPGKIWSITGAIQLLRRFSIPGSIGLSVVLVQDGIANITGLITGSPMLADAHVMKVLPLGWLIGPLVVACGIIALSPPVFSRLINFALVKLGRQPLTTMPDIVHYVGPVLLMFGQWALAGVGVWLMAMSVTQVHVAQIPLFISIAGLAYTVSYLVLIAPAGAGPRELIFNAALVPVLGPTAAIVVVTLRIVQTLVELMMAGLGMIALRLSPNDESRGGGNPNDETRNPNE